jgi:hypothetical protein
MGAGLIGRRLRDTKTPRLAAAFFYGGMSALVFWRLGHLFSA